MRHSGTMKHLWLVSIVCCIAMVIPFTTAAQAPLAVTKAATGVTSTGATLNGTVNANGSLTTVTFEYGSDTSYGTTVTASQSPVTGSINTAVSKVITGLSKGATYHYRVVAQSSHGTTYGADMTFTTAAQAPLAVTKAATGVTSTTATLNGMVNANDSETTVTFEYGLTTSYGNTVTASQSPVTGSINTAVSKVITGLSKGTTYHYRVVAQSSQGTIYGADMTFTTAAQAPSAATNPATSVTSTGAILNGTINDNGSETTVTFEYGLDTSYGNTVTADQSPVAAGSGNTPVSKAITGLSKGETYHYRVVAQSSQGTTYGADMTFTTLAEATISIEPDTLNLKSRGKWITCYIELPAGYDVGDINVGTVRLENAISAKTRPTEIGDNNRDGIPDLMVKFDRGALIEHLGDTSGDATLTVTGTLDNGTPFEGSDTIKVIYPGKPAPAKPTELALLQNYPNPPNPDTWIPYQLAEDVDVAIRIYSASGQLVRILDLGHKPAGFYTTKDRAAYWDGRNETGERVSSGIYFYIIQAGADFTATKKMVIAK